MRHLLSPLLLALCLMCCLSAASVVRAQGSPEYEALVRQAVAEFDQAHWEEARALFRKAHELEPNARTWRSLGITAFELRRYVDAIRELEASLSDTRKPLNDAQRTEIEALLARTREFVSVYRVHVSPAGATLLLDGQPAELSNGELILDPGDHTLTVRAPGYEEVRERIRADAGSGDELSIALSSTPGVAPRIAEPPDVRAPERDGTELAKPKRLWSWVLGGAAVAAAIAGAGVGVATWRKHDAYDRCVSNCEGLRTKGQALDLATVVTMSTAGVLLGGAGLAYYLEGRSSSPRHVTATIRPSGVDLSISF